MAESKCINPAQLEVLGDHIVEIGAACVVLQQLGIEITGKVPDETCLGQSVRLFAEKAGWLADECARLLKTSPGPIKGDWKQWTLAPTTRAALAKLNPSGGC